MTSGDGEKISIVRTPRKAEYEATISSLRKALTNANNKIARVNLDYVEMKQIKNRLKRLTKWKLKLEKELEIVKKRCRITMRVSALEIKSHQSYAASCLRLYEACLEIIRKNIIRMNGKRTVVHRCNKCGPKPITEFSIRITDLGNLAFLPYCYECEKTRKNTIQKERRVSSSQMAKNMVAVMPKVSRRIVDQLTEEIDDTLLHSADQI